MNKFTALLLIILYSTVPLAQTLIETKPKQDHLPNSSRVDELNQVLQARTQSPVKVLDIDLIMLGPDFAGTQPSEVSWAGDNSKLWFRWKRAGDKELGVFEVA